MCSAYFMALHCCYSELYFKIPSFGQVEQEKTTYVVKFHQHFNLSYACKLVNQGPVVRSIVSLTISLRGQC